VSDAQTLDKQGPSGPAKGAGPARPAAAAKPAAPTAKAKAAAGMVVLQDRYTINPTRPYPELSTPQTPAFVAEDPMTPGEVRAALICDVDPLPRIDVADKLKGLARPGLTQVAAFGAVDWPGADGQRLAVVIHPPQGGRLVPMGATKFAKMSPELLLEQVVRPVVTGLTEMFHRNQTHRGIRPDNLFFSDPTRTRIVLGQSVTAPAGYYQTPPFETIECSTADPDGKGTGTRAEDMFSLGTTLLALLMGHVPGDGMSDEEYFAQRIEKGSLDAAIDPREIPRDMIDGLRGLMADDSRERWTLEQFKRLRLQRQEVLVGAGAGARFDAQAGCRHQGPAVGRRARVDEEEPARQYGDRRAGLGDRRIRGRGQRRQRRRAAVEGVDRHGSVGADPLFGL